MDRGRSARPLQRAESGNSGRCRHYLHHPLIRARRAGDQMDLIAAEGSTYLSVYLGIEVDDALEIAEQVEI